MKMGMGKPAVRDITKQSSVQLPNRKAMNQLGKSGQSILDYGKMSPITPDPAAAVPSLIQNLRKGP